MLTDSPGTTIVPTTEVGRFALFTVSLAGTQQPAGSRLIMTASADVTENLNGGLRQLHDDDAWVWIMGDDHCWDGAALMRLLALMDDHDLDILVPLVLKRNPPWVPVLFRDQGDTDEGGHPLYRTLATSEIPDAGVFEVDAAGSAGMLIRREVIDRIGDPWFYSHTDTQGRRIVLSEDLTFCRRATREHGFRIHATPEVTLGHIGVFRVWPAHRDGHWGALTEFSATEDQYRTVYLPTEGLVLNDAASR